MSNVEFRADYVIIVPPTHMAELGIAVTDFTAINATTMQPKKTFSSLKKVQEMIFAALLQGYEVVANNNVNTAGIHGFTVIKLIPKEEVERIGKLWKVEKRNE